MDMLLLSIPRQHSKQNSSVELNSKQLVNWVDNLPMDDVFELVKLVQDKLDAFNEIKLDNNARLKLLEIYWEAVESISFLYDHKRLDMLPVDQVQKTIIAEDIMWLFITLANGYKSILLNFIDSAVSPKKDHVLQTAIIRAFELLVQTAIYAYTGHKTVPPLVHLEINQLYFYMEKNNCLDHKIKTKESQNTINNLYKQFMFTAILNPYSLNGDDIFQSQFILKDFITKVKITKNEKTNSCDRYLIDLEEDLAPIALSKVKSDIHIPSVRSIDISNTLISLSSWVSEKETLKINSFEKNDVLLIKRILDIFNSERIRIEKRTASNKKVRIAVGINAISYFLSSIDNILKEYSEESKTENDDNKFSLQEWIVKDECNQGRKITIPCENLKHEIQIGELIGIVDPMKSNSGFHPVIVVGIIRWKRKKNTNLDIGVEIIPGNPCHANKIISNNTQSLYPGIYIPAEEVLSRPSAIIVEKMAYQPKRLLNMTIKDKTHLIEMGTIFAESALYVQCEFFVST